MRAAGGAWGSAAPICLDGLANGEGDLRLRIWGNEAERRRGMRGRKQTQNQDELRQNSACELTCRKRLPRRAKTVPTGGRGDGSVFKRLGSSSEAPGLIPSTYNCVTPEYQKPPSGLQGYPPGMHARGARMYMKQNTHTH